MNRSDVKSINTLLRKLTFDDLRDWAGEKILNRGMSYVKRVDILSYTADHTLVAWVNGGQQYATSVRVDEHNDFEYFCTCPYDWGPCKHAVAVILATAEHVKRKEAIPLLDEENDLREALFRAAEEEDDEWEDGERDDDHLVRTTTPQGTKAQAKVAQILGDKSRDELLDLLIDLSGRFPHARQRIVQAEQLASGQTDKLVRALRSEIRDLTAEPAWFNHWRGEGSLPDFSHVEEQLRAMADRGHADAILTLVCADASHRLSNHHSEIEGSNDSLEDTNVKRPHKGNCLRLAEREGFEPSVFLFFSMAYKDTVSRSCLTEAGDRTSHLSHILATRQPFAAYPQCIRRSLACP